jgi:two-component system cell cycle sensor histidine kinase/response regulator CckA
MNALILRLSKASHMAATVDAADGAGPSPLFWAGAAGAALLVTLVGVKAAAPLSVIVLGLFALAGGFFLLLLALGQLAIGEGVTGAGLASVAAEALDEAVLVTGVDARIRYANAAARRLLADGGASSGLSLDGLYAGEPDATEALYRLRRAAGRGEARIEEFAVAARVLSVAVSPLAPEHVRRPPSATLWRLRDVTQTVNRDAAARDKLESLLALYERLPVGVVVAESDGTVMLANALVRERLGYDARLATERGLTLADMLSPDSVQLVTAQARRRGEALPLDLDIRAADQSLHPVRLMATEVAGRATATSHAGAAEPLRLIAFTEHAADATGPDAGTAAETRFSSLVQAAPFGIATVDADGRIVSANSAFARLSLNGTGGLKQRAVDLLVPASDADTRAAVEAALESAIARRADAKPIEIALGAKREYARRLFFHPALRSGGAGFAAILYLVDATEEKALQAKFAQSQKMDAIGKLVGGIAHDFNNMLTAIIGYSDILLQTHRPTDAAHADITNIKTSAERAAKFVAKLLTLSRQRTLKVEPLLLDEVVTDWAPMLNRSIGETIDIKIQNGRDLWHVRTDRGEIEQAILNLAVNARDAMPGGGRLTLRTRNVTERETRKLGLEGMVPGEYVLLEVEDTGTGIAPEILAKIFEPFFTTKAVGKGTGLGLGEVMGTVKQSGGYIYADSTLGKGTTFRIYLPRYHVDAEDEAAAARAAKAAKDKAPVDITGSGRVLLVEDEDVVRSFAVRALKSRGYEVLEAGDGREALEVMEAEGGKVDVVVSDVVMPEMDGPTLMKRLREKRPEIKIIFVSGYPNEAFRASLDEKEQFDFLAKPFSLPQLAAKVKEVLGR